MAMNNLNRRTKLIWFGLVSISLVAVLLWICTRKVWHNTDENLVFHDRKLGNFSFYKTRKALNLSVLAQDEFYYHALKADYPDCEIFYLSKTSPLVIGLKDEELVLIRIGRSAINELKANRQSDLMFGISDLSKIWSYIKSEFDRANILLPWEADYVVNSNFLDSVKVLTIPYNDGPEIIEAHGNHYKIIASEFGQNSKRFKMLCHFDEGRNVGIEFIKSPLPPKP
jgi:hypothetical protein